MTATRAELDSAVRRLDRGSLGAARWFGGKGRAIAGVGLAEGFELPGEDRHVLAVVDVAYERGPADRYLVPFVVTAGALRPAVEGDGTWRALAVAIAEGRTIPAMPPEPEPRPESESQSTDATTIAGPVSAALVCRPSKGLTQLVAPGPGPAPAAIGGMTERALGLDQSNTSVVLGERLLLKAYRWVQPGLNPDLELTAYLAEEARFGSVPRLGGYAELVTRQGAPATIAMLQEFVAGGDDAYEQVVETVAGWLLAPGQVAVEFATEVAAEIGALTADLHAALAAARGVPDFEPRPAKRAELREWHAAARTQLDRALEVTPGEHGRILRRLAPAIAEELTVFEAIATEPLVTRVHADYHLGQVIVTADGFRIVDFEGEPTRALEERRAYRSPLRDVASMLRSFDHAGRSAGHRAEERSEGPLANPGLDLPAWLQRSRSRFLDAYAAGLRAAGASIAVDPALVRAFEIEKECYEFIYAATYLPDWLWAPTEGMLGLIDGAG